MAGHNFNIRSLSRQLVDQIVGKLQIRNGAVLLDEVGGADDPALAAELAEDAADLSLQLLAAHEADSVLHADTAQNGEFVGIFFQES